ncbi:MAG: PQQ-binding-like beta-propeller repeat protein [Ignavibacteriales bacterium]|nr:PQQ-binding-like beta-propeller repeat protein [Ignavibacteriales bacterium]
MKKEALKSIVLVSMIIFSGCYSSIAIKNFNPELVNSPAGPEFDSLIVVETMETHGSLVPGGLGIHGDHLFAGDFSGRIYAFDLKDFEEVGYASIRNTSISASPQFMGDKMYYLYRKKLLPELHLVKYNLRSGKEELDVAVGVSGEASLHQFETEIIVIAGKEVIFYDTLLIEQKRVEVVEESSCVTSREAGKIYLGSYSGTLYEIDINGKSIKKHKPEFNEPFLTITKIGDNFVVSLESGRLVYAGESGHWFWEHETGKVVATPLIAGGFLYTGTLSGIVLKISIKTGEVVAKFDTGGLINLPLSVSGNKIVAPVVDGRLFLLGASKLDLIQTINFEGRIRTSAIGNGDFLFLGYDNGKIAVLKPLTSQVRD